MEAGLVVALFDAAPDGPPLHAVVHMQQVHRLIVELLVDLRELLTQLFDVLHLQSQQIKLFEGHRVETTLKRFALRVRHFQ